MLSARLTLDFRYSSGKSFLKYPMYVRNRQPSLARRAISALVVGFWLFGLVGSLFHGVGHEHTFCPQHKTFEEAGAAANQGSADESSYASTGTAAKYQHEACAFADLGVRAPQDPPVTLILTRPTAPAPAPAPLLVAVAPPIALLALAPKSSPPARSV
jgi:hypothetical protein